MHGLMRYRLLWRLRTLLLVAPLFRRRTRGCLRRLGLLMLLLVRLRRGSRVRHRGWRSARMFCRRWRHRMLRLLRRHWMLRCHRMLWLRRRRVLRFLLGVLWSRPGARRLWRTMLRFWCPTLWFWCPTLWFRHRTLLLGLNLRRMRQRRRYFRMDRLWRRQCDWSVSRHEGRNRLG